MATKTVVKKVKSDPVKKATAKKATANKTTTNKTTTNKTTTNKTTTNKTTTKKAGTERKLIKTKSTAKNDAVTLEIKKLINVTGPSVREQMIAEEAYYRAEKRGFDPDGQVEDWLEAESKIDTLLPA